MLARQVCRSIEGLLDPNRVKPLTGDPRTTSAISNFCTIATRFFSDRFATGSVPWRRQADGNFGSVVDIRAVNLQGPLSGGKQALRGTEPTGGCRPAADIRAGQRGWGSEASPRPKREKMLPSQASRRGRHYSRSERCGLARTGWEFLMGADFAARRDR